MADRTVTFTPSPMLKRLQQQLRRTRALAARKERKLTRLSSRGARQRTVKRLANKVARLKESVAQRHIFLTGLARSEARAAFAK